MAPMSTSSGAIERFDDKARESFESVGHTTIYRGELLRHPVYTRVLHWTVALFFFLALFSGFALYLPWLFHWITPVFGGGQLTRTLHPYFGVAFVFFFAFQVLTWLEPMLWTAADSRWMRNIKKITTGEEKMDPPETGFFNAGQKILFWEVVVGCVLYIITGTILWAGARTFGATAVAISYVVHDISAIVMLGGIFIHIYQSTIGERSEEHTSELQSQSNLVCRLLLEKKKNNNPKHRASHTRRNLERYLRPLWSHNTSPRILSSVIHRRSMPRQAIIRWHRPQQLSSTHAGRSRPRGIR